LVSSYPEGSDEICITVVFLTFKNTEAEAKLALQPAESSFPGHPVVHWFAQETTLEKEYAQQTLTCRPGHRYYNDNAFIDNGADVSSVLEKALTTIPNKETFAFWNALAPCSRRPLPDMAFSLRTDHYLALYTICKEETDDKICENWARDVIASVNKYSVGSYIGDIDIQIRNTKFWGDEQGTKLMSIRRKWDPKGIVCGYLDRGDKSGVKGLDNKLDQADG
jgi:hypothetical protein